MNSPDSLAPSLADTSMGSPDEQQQGGDETTNGIHLVPEPDKEQVVTPRRLCFTQDIDASGFTMYNICHFQSSPLASNTEVRFGSEVFSTTSSQTTVAATKNLSMRDTLDADTYFPSLCLREEAVTEETSITYPSDFQNPDTAMHSHSDTPICAHSDVVEPPEVIPTCNSALGLTHRQLAELFGTFQYRKKTPELPSLLSTAREELLLRECALLKRIIQDDATTIVRLTQGLEHHRNVLNDKDIELEDKDVEIRIALDRIDALKREKEVLREREDDDNNTIRILKMEVDKLSAMIPSSYRTGVELEPSKHGECCIQVAAREEENAELASLELYVDNNAHNVELGEFHSQDTFDSADEFRSQDEIHSQEESQLEFAWLSVILKDVAERLTAIESKVDDSEARFLRAIEEHSFEMDDIRKVLHLTRNSGHLLSISRDAGEVEVVLPATVSAKRAVSTIDQGAGCCCNVWATPMDSFD